MIKITNKLSIKTQFVCLITIIAFYHFFIQNGLEKIFFESYFEYDDVKRPLSKCANSTNGQKTECIGMPSGHAETVTIIATLLYLYKFITLPICLLLIFVFSAQRIISDMHTTVQVICGILFGAFYVLIYKSFHLSMYSLLIVISIGIIFALLSVYKIDQKIYGPIPNWVDPKMFPSIRSKQESPLYSKMFPIYLNSILKNITYISWNQLEKNLDVIIDKIKQSGQQYDAVVGIKTGGAILSDYISKKLGIANYKIKLSRSEYNCDKKPYNVINDIINKRILQNYGEYTICEPIDDNLNGKNIILIDEFVSSGKTMNEAYNYLQNTKNANIVYPVCFAVEENRYKGDIYIHRVTNGTIMAWPWGYDN
jgi:hypoxanthine phosphoribosyltransferase